MGAAVSADDEIRAIELMAHIYRRVSWGKLHTRHRTWDIWSHRVRASAARGTIGEFVSRLCNHFGLQSLPAEAIDLMMQVRPNERAVLKLIYTEHIPMAMRAVSRSRQMWDDRKEVASE